MWLLFLICTSVIWIFPQWSLRSVQYLVLVSGKAKSNSWLVTTWVIFNLFYAKKGANNYPTSFGLSLLIIVVFPLLSSPIQRTFISFFFKPSQLASLSKTPMITGLLYHCSYHCKNCFWIRVLSNHATSSLGCERLGTIFWRHTTKMVVRKCRIFCNFLRFSLNICRFSSTFTGEARKYNF